MRRFFPSLWFDLSLKYWESFPLFELSRAMRMCLLLTVKGIGTSQDIYFIPFCLQDFFYIPVTPDHVLVTNFHHFLYVLLFFFIFIFSVFCLPFCTPHAVYSILCPFEFTSLSKLIFFHFFLILIISWMLFCLFSLSPII